MAWNRPENGEANSRSLQKRSGDRYGFAYCWRNRPIRGTIAGMIVVVGAGIAAWWLWPEDGAAGSSKPPYRDGLIREAMPAKKPSSGAGQAASDRAATNEAAVAVATNAVEMFRGQRVVKKTVVTNGSYLITRVYTADGNFHRIEDWVMPPDGLPSSTDQLLAMAIGGDDMPPIPVAPGADAEFRKSLETPIIVLHTDSEEIKAWKRSMNEARLQMKDQLDAGKTFAEVIAEHQEMTRHNTEMRAKVQAELVKIVDGGDMEGAKQYLETMNEALDSMGIKPIVMPKTPEERAAALQELIERRGKAK